MITFNVGDAVTVTWSGKTGIVADPSIRHHPDNTPGVLVVLNAFVADWHDDEPSQIVGLEGIYAAEDLIRRRYVYRVTREKAKIARVLGRDMPYWRLPPAPEWLRRQMEVQAATLKTTLAGRDADNRSPGQ